MGERLVADSCRTFAQSRQKKYIGPRELPMDLRSGHRTKKCNMVAEQLLSVGSYVELTRHAEFRFPLESVSSRQYIGGPLSQAHSADGQDANRLVPPLPDQS